MNYEQWLSFAQKQLKQYNLTENVKLDALVLLQFVTKRSKASIMAFGETILSDEILEKLTALLERRLKGEPIAYILGEKEFWSMPLWVSEDTLIPRPDTEILVEKAFELAMLKIQKCGKSLKNFRVLDLGTGTGAIALALAKELTPIVEQYQLALEVIGTDIMANAVALAQRNAQRNHIAHVNFLQSNWFQQLENQQFDIIVSNPPYIAPQDKHLQNGDVRFEPLTALVAEQEGYADLRHIIENAPLYLKPQGWLMLEHGWQQGEKVRSIFTELSQNSWESIATIKDYGDNERITIACWNK
ncbi:peptide chain release factor N(5)-glutamine methyltransferase [Mannheimia massilioguelmaensis]|uniref:peptide chain release factor N(5)-glutamine methyltransferase n=1 Tax=Mannheimia massilioguelmaensis TaxID=1604354 RepID=UPI0005C820C7|nr:peptide chain release factor N(5)-glutamine methyltransferase [Mannheimia massilioguelmaensis]